MLRKIHSVVLFMLMILSMIFNVQFRKGLNLVMYILTVSCILTVIIRVQTIIKRTFWKRAIDLLKLAETKQPTTMKWKYLLFFIGYNGLFLLLLLVALILKFEPALSLILLFYPKLYIQTVLLVILSMLKTQFKLLNSKVKMIGRNDFLRSKLAENDRQIRVIKSTYTNLFQITVCLNKIYGWICLFQIFYNIVKMLPLFDWFINPEIPKLHEIKEDFLWLANYPIQVVSNVFIYLTE